MQTGHLNLKPSGWDLISETYLMDCMQGMKEYPDNYFDLAIVDPPYGIGASSVNYKNRTSKTAKPYYKVNCWDTQRPPLAYFTELMRVSRNLRCFICWDKTIHGNSYADCELAWTSFDSVARYYRKNIAQVNIEGRIHPTQKPITLYDFVFKEFTEQGQKVIDTHLGSGASRIAAHKNGLHFVGFEIDEEYYYSQEARFKTYLSQPTLFSIPRGEGVLNSNAPTLNFEQGTEL